MLHCGLRAYYTFIININVVGFIIEYSLFTYKLFWHFAHAFHHMYHVTSMAPSLLLFPFLLKKLGSDREWSSSASQFVSAGNALVTI